MEHRAQHYGTTPNLKVQVATMAGRIIEIDIAKRARLADLVRMLSIAMSIPKRRLQLISGDTTLGDPMTRIIQIAEQAEEWQEDALCLAVIVGRVERTDTDSSMPTLTDSSSSGA